MDITAPTSVLNAPATPRVSSASATGTEPPAQTVTRALRFEPWGDERQVVVRVFDVRTGVLVREIPPAELESLMDAGELPAHLVQEQA